MVKENGTVMMSEGEYNKLIEENRKLDHDLDIAKMELSTYRRSMFDLAVKNLNGNRKDGSFGVEVTPNDFADIIDQIVFNTLDGEIKGVNMSDVFEEDFWFVWNGMCCRILLGCEVNNYITPAIKDAYKDSLA